MSLFYDVYDRPELSFSFAEFSVELPNVKNALKKATTSTSYKDYKLQRRSMIRIIRAFARH